MEAATINPSGAWRRWTWRAADELPLLVIVVLLLSTGAEFLPPDTLLAIGEVKLNAERLLLLVGFAALLATRRPHLADFRTGLALPLAVLLAAGLIATLKWGTEPRYRFLVESVVLFYLAVGVVRTRHEARGALVTIGVVAVALSAIVGLTQVSQGEATGFYRVGCLPVQEAPPGIPADSITRARGTFANPNLLAAHVLLLAPLAMLAAFRAPGRERLAIGLIAALAYVALVFTFSRAAVVLAVAGLAVVALIGGGDRRGLLALAGIGAALIAGALLGSCGVDGASGDFGRVDTWRETFRIATGEPLTGVGLGRTADVLAASNPTSTFAHAHNLWLTWWADAGSLALLAWVAIAGVLLWRVLRSARTGDAISRAVLISLVGFFAFSLVDHPANVDRVALTFWIIAAIAAAGLPAAKPAGRRPPHTAYEAGEPAVPETIDPIVGARERHPGR